VRAIADGTIVYVRKTDTTEKAALSYRGVRTDDGCVVIRHTTEIGEGDSAKVTFFSIYMHLQTVTAPAVGKNVYRKDVLGVAGLIYGQRGQIHFEIVCDETNLMRLVGRTTGHLTAAAGRTDAVYGDVWFKVPRGALIFRNEPHPNREDDQGPAPCLYSGIQPQPGTPTTAEYVIRMRYTRGNCSLATFQQQDDGSFVEVGSPSVREGYEYGLYKEATRLNGKYVELNQAAGCAYATAPAPSVIYEILRFGHVVGPDAMPANAKFGHWREIATPGITGWVNLSAPGISVYSDADFPHWAEWSLIDDNATSDSRCDAFTIKRWLDLDDDGDVSHADAVGALQSELVQRRLSKAICRFPSEWSRDEQAINHRWGWLMSASDALSTPLSESDFRLLKEHIQALAFWEDVHEDEYPKAEACWHFPPKAFVEHFGKCGWLSAEEMAQCFPRRLMHLQGAQFHRASTSWETAFVRARAWVAAFNIGARRYGLSGYRIRLLHLFSHVIPETGNLHYVKEIGGEGMVYSPYYGRGLIQLTHIGNYKSYGLFRCLHDQNLPVEFRELGWNPDIFIAKNNNGNHNAYNCVDSACFYVISRSGMLAHMDAGVGINHAVTLSKDVNGYVAIENLNGLEVRLQSVAYLTAILLDESNGTDPVAITFEWRRNSQKEPVHDAQGHVVMVGQPPRPQKKFYRAQHTIHAALERQQPF
jgi:hydroxyethylthiazole kinase